MVGRWVWASGLCIAMGSMLVWTGCSGSEEGSPATPADDGGAGNDDADDPPGGDDAGGGEAGPEPEPPPTVNIDYGQCPAFNACGGDVKGRWTVSGGCLGDDAFSDLKQGGCAAVTEHDVVITAAGVLEVGDTSLRRKTSIDLSATLEIPQACLDDLQVPTCLLAEFGLTTPLGGGEAPFDTAKCDDLADGGCSCEVTKAVIEDVESDYTASGNTVTTTQPTRTFDYCVSGDTSTFQETTAGSLPLIVKLAK